MTQIAVTTELQADRHSYTDYAALLEDYYERGWTDGLPVVPPTPEAVERFLDFAGLAPTDILGAVPTREVVVTAEHAAINAVMAGCKTEYFPVVVAAVRAHLNEKANCHSTTGTLSGAAQIVIVNGPIRRQLDINCEAGCFGPGWRANATIGRALRLVIRNVCRAVPNFLDRATFSRPARYSFCFGENEEVSDWVPMHVERGFDLETSTATVHSAMTIHSAEEMSARTPEGILDTIILNLKRKGTAGDRWLGDETNVVMVIGREHQRWLVSAGWSKADIRNYMWPRLMEAPKAGERPIKLAHPEGLLIVAAGGPGMAETWLFFPHLASAVTEAIVMPGQATAASAASPEPQETP